MERIILFIRNRESAFVFRRQVHSEALRTSGTHSLVIPHVNTTRYGLHSLSYYGSKLWNSLPNTTRSLPTVKAFKSSIRNLDFESYSVTRANREPESTSSHESTSSQARVKPMFCFLTFYFVPERKIDCRK